MEGSVENAERSSEEERNALDVGVKNTESFTMTQSQRNKVTLRDLYCPECKKVTPHEIEKREGCDKSVGIVGICIFCEKVRVLEKRIRIEEE